MGMTLGVVAGYAFGRLAVWTINRMNIENQSLYAVLLLAFVFLTFSVTDLIHRQRLSGRLCSGTGYGELSDRSQEDARNVFRRLHVAVSGDPFRHAGTAGQYRRTVAARGAAAGRPDGSVHDPRRTSRRGLPLAAAVPQVHHPRPPLRFVGGAARRRADHLRHLSRRGRRGGSRACCSTSSFS